MHKRGFPRTWAVGAAVLWLGGTAWAPGQTTLRSYPSKYYIIHSDMDRSDIREIDLRITHMAEEYAARTREFGGRISQKLPFYIFQRPQDYYAAGGMPGSAGVFTGDKLMAIGGKDISPQTWHVIQHEGFHQFAVAVIGGQLPPWVNEGLAEYFGVSVYTGDGYVSGVIPQPRLDYVRRSIQTGSFKSVRNLMKLDHGAWNAHISLGDAQAGANYVQAWSMVHFLAHGEDGKYQKAFNGFLVDVGRGKEWEAAWEQNFGRGVSAFEQRWREYWQALPANPTADLYAKADVATLTSFLARAVSQRQTFEDVGEFFAVARAGELKAGKGAWLPPALLQNALRNVDRHGTWSLKRQPGQTMLVCRTSDGTTLTGEFELRGREVAEVRVRFDRKSRD